MGTAMSDVQCAHKPRDRGARDREDRASEVPRREPTGQGATARVGGTIVARSDSVQLANRRVYFPVEHCVRRHFQRSAKRWR